jgi:hypothetical protein
LEAEGAVRTAHGHLERTTVVHIADREFCTDFHESSRANALGIAHERSHLKAVGEEPPRRRGALPSRATGHKNDLLRHPTLAPSIGFFKTVDYRARCRLVSRALNVLA